MRAVLAHRATEGLPWRIARVALAFLAFALMTLAMTACRTLPSPAPAPASVASSAPWEERRAALQQRDRFNLSGRIAVAAANEGFSARLRWQQQGQRSQL